MPPQPQRPKHQGRTPRETRKRDVHMRNPERPKRTRPRKSLVPPNLEICPLPHAVSSWVTSCLRSQPPTKALRKEPTRRTLWHGRDGANGCGPWSSSTTSSLGLPQTRTQLLGAFASAIRSARFSGPIHTQLASGTVSHTVNHVAASFVDAGFNDPRRTEVGGPSSRFLQRQYKCYKNLDANIKQQKAITASILLNMIAHANLPFATPAEKATSELAMEAFFFAMRSCEYTDVSGPRRTKPLSLRHIRFFRNNKALDLVDPTLLSAAAILITFEFQKTDIHHETVHQHATILPNLCPVKALAKVVRRVLSYPGCDTESLVSTVLTPACHLRFPCHPAPSHSPTHWP
jgi:hypothetical protein